MKNRTENGTVSNPQCQQDNLDQEKKSACAKHKPDNGNTAQDNRARKQGQILYKEAYERVNFLYQAAMSVILTQPHNIELVRHYMKCIRDIKDKKTLRLARQMKHSICDRCNMLLVPGVTAAVSVRDKGLLERMTCLSCNTKKQKMFLSTTRIKKKAKVCTS